MKYLNEELYQKTQLFHFPAEGNLTMEELLEEFELDLEEFLWQELMANEEAYQKYLPGALRHKLFDEHGEISFQETDEELLKEITKFRQAVESEWAKVTAKIRQEKQLLRKTASPAVRKLLDLELNESEIRRVSGVETDKITMKLYPAWDMGKVVTLTFTGVKDGWMSHLHPDDADWWLADEIIADEEREGRYVMYALFGNAASVGGIQFSFSDVEVLEQNDPLGF